ncbi:hypothetical protein [Clostridium thailandense]|uniref:hypothetical protein n=1 Tax=Clostridium thailandense TaxID=2794346 RepID=UPI003989AC73
MNEKHISSITILGMAKEELKDLIIFEDEEGSQILHRAIRKIDEGILEIKNYLKYTQR